MDVETYSAKELPGAAAGWIAARAEPAIAERGRFTIAVSGGSTPAAMFAELARGSICRGRRSTCSRSTSASLPTATPIAT